MGIGCVIGANLYNANDFPIQVGNLVFGIDSIVYTVFVFSILLAYIDYGNKLMKEVLYCSAGSILLTALLALSGNFFQVGLTDSVLLNFFYYFFSLIGTLAAIYLMIYVYKKLENKINIYLNIAIALVIASIINSAVYFGLSFIMVGGLGGAFLQTLVGSYIGKTISLCFCLVAFYILNLIKQKNIVKTEKDNNKVLNKD
ncbi:MAG: hypothetical protein PHH71_03560 [Clostridia bacterium]|nr:hypothetical protein [Clostridia bacterium]MDD3232192.1 hypothetical protein [Clostridia bacterium]